MKPPLTGRWHHGNGVLVCGTIRIARADFDTNPSQQFQDEMFEWMCEGLNKAVEEARAAEPDPFAAHPEAIPTPSQTVAWDPSVFIGYSPEQLDLICKGFTHALGLAYAAETKEEMKS